MRWQRGDVTVERIDEPGYSLGSADNGRPYSNEYVLGPWSRHCSRHGVVCVMPEVPVGTALIAVSGGGTGVHTHSLALLGGRCCAAVGNTVVCMGPPDLALRWHVQGDQATCLGVHLTHDQSFLVVHGELEISLLTLEGQRVWSCSGRDVFTGDLKVDEQTVHVVDFNGARYTIGLETGRIVEAADQAVSGLLRQEGSDVSSSNLRSLKP